MEILRFLDIFLSISKILINLIFIFLLLNFKHFLFLNIYIFFKYSQNAVAKRVNSYNRVARLKFTDRKSNIFMLNDFKSINLIFIGHS